MENIESSAPDTGSVDTAPVMDSNEDVTGSTEPTQDKVSDVWHEDFKLDGDAPVEAKAELQETPKDEKAELKYVADGLGDLDTPVVLKRKGKLLDITSMDELKSLAERGLDSTIKNQELAGHRDMIETLKTNSISMEDINLLANAKNGSLEALKQLQSQYSATSEVDVQDMTTDATQSEIRAIAEKADNSPYANDFVTVLGAIDAPTLAEFKQYPEALELLRGEVENGNAIKYLPQVEKAMAVHNMDFVSAYEKVSGEAKASNTKRKATADSLSSAPRATSSNRNSGSKDVWQMSSDDWNSLNSRMRT